MYSLRENSPPGMSPITASGSIGVRSAHITSASASSSGNSELTASANSSNDASDFSASDAGEGSAVGRPSVDAAAKNSPSPSGARAYSRFSSSIVEKYTLSTITRPSQ